MLATVKPFVVEIRKVFYYEDLTHSQPLQAKVKFARHSFPLALFPSFSALEREIEVVRAERAWYFFSRKNSQR